MKLKISEMLGWFGVIIIQGSTLPITTRAIISNNVDLPPFDLIFLVWSGLLLLLIRSLTVKDYLYIASNSIGLTLNTVLLAILFANS